MSERDRARSKDYFFRTPGGNVDNRIDEPLVAELMANTPDLTFRWPKVPLSALGKHLGALDIAKPSPEEVAKYLADIEAMNAPPNFEQRWPDDLQRLGMRPMAPSTERGFASK